MTGGEYSAAGYHGALLGPERWTGAAAAALGTRTVVEVWRDGHGVRQELAGIRPGAARSGWCHPAGPARRT
ncbi:hypothetical protein [Streptomyces sp. Ag109_G2-15]|uniref:hypothetical protein n=1 Tax=Streptomyces sp. Ag109_G2-15 TaxID=1938850 RepID=UPI000BD84588|nr:hypothetical protein [Streptomyces sp. Ag109_G2-15]SOE07494.1 hypothetical protein SAMN06272765_8391 [Streptomyces sp. Ag109_G2-15]